MYAYVLETGCGFHEGLCALRDQACISSDPPPPCHSWIASCLCVRRTLTRSCERYTLGEPKTKRSRRSIRLTPRAADVLEQHLERQLSDIQMLGDNYSDQCFVFSTDTGNPFNPSNVRQRSFAPL
jgi:hypothetical protein